MFNCGLENGVVLNKMIHIKKQLTSAKGTGKMFEKDKKTLNISQNFQNCGKSISASTVKKNLSNQLNEAKLHTNLE